MKPAERDNLLIRLDERASNTYHLCEKLEQHQGVQNERLSEHDKITASNKKSIGLLWKVFIASGVVGGIGGGIYGFWG